MGAAEWSLLGVTGATILTVLVGYLLSREDAQKAEFIKDLYEKHKEITKAAFELQRNLDRNYHPKGEINELFKQQKLHMDERFDRIERGMGIDRRGKIDGDI